jgi:hypothetical protein
MGELRKESQINKQRANQFKQQRNKRALNESHETARRARRELRNLVKDETKKEDRWQEEEARMNAIEEGVLQLNTSAQKAQRSVGIIISFIAEQFVGRIPQEICQGCKASLLPENPSDAKGIFDSKSKQRPQRVYCGHWWHTTCLNSALTLPPFGLQGCPGKGCGSDVRIWHHEWSRDIRKHEKAWSNKKAREREIQEVAEIFGFDDDDDDDDDEDDEDDEDDDE